jgi:cobalt-zinc-cadmium efflux system protein
MAHHSAASAVRDEDSRAASRGLLLALALTTVIMLIEVAGGLVSGSLALLSDAGHMLTDALALAMAWFAVSVARRPSDPRRSYGYHRVEILAALTNGVILVVICLAIVYEAWDRLVQPPVVNGPLVGAVAAVGLATNLAGMWILSRAGRSLNVRCARMHVVSDALASVGVLVAGIVIALTSWHRLDPLVSIAIAGAILLGAWRLLRETVDILLEGAPHGVDPAEVSRAIATIDGIQGVHDLHVWCITSGMWALSGHVILDAASLTRSDAVLNHIKEMLRERFAIDHTTIQIESESYAEVGEIHHH